MVHGGVCVHSLGQGSLGVGVALLLAGVAAL